MQCCHGVACPGRVAVGWRRGPASGGGPGRQRQCLDGARRVARAGAGRCRRDPARDPGEASASNRVAVVSSAVAACCCFGPASAGAGAAGEMPSTTAGHVTGPGKAIGPGQHQSRQSPRASRRTPSGAVMLDVHGIKSPRKSEMICRQCGKTWESEASHQRPGRDQHCHSGPAAWADGSVALADLLPRLGCAVVEHGLRAPVLRPAGDVVAHRDRPLLAVGDGADALAVTPLRARKSRTAVARRAPSAMLYSRVPRSSAWPSMVMVYCEYCCSQRA